MESIKRIIDNSFLYLLLHFNSNSKLFKLNYSKYTMVRFFDQIVTNFENSMRGMNKVNNKLVKAFPHTAGSVFISKIVSLLHTIVNDKNVYSELADTIVKERIYRNGKAVVVMMVLDETVDLENMLFIFESFQNISIDTYLGMKAEGKYGKLQERLGIRDEPEEEQEEQLIA